MNDLAGILNNLNAKEDTHYTFCKNIIICTLALHQLSTLPLKLKKRKAVTNIHRNTFKHT